MKTSEIVEYISNELGADVESIYESEYDGEIMLSISGIRSLHGTSISKMKLRLQSLQTYRDGGFFLICGTNREDIKKI
ncbi:MAG: hypothetical protein ACRCUJ_08030 [Phocaeicola sp.]